MTRTKGAKIKRRRTFLCVQLFRWYFVVGILFHTACFDFHKLCSLGFDTLIFYSLVQKFVPEDLGLCPQ